MPISPYIQALRAKVGRALLVIPSVSVMVFDQDGRLLLARDAGSGSWITIGGAIEPDEAPADAAVRECWEEAGLLVEPIRLIGVFAGPEFRVTYVNGDVVAYVSTMFEARVVGGELRPDGFEVADLGFFSQAQATALPMTPRAALLIAAAFRRDAQPWFARPTWRPNP